MEIHGNGRTFASAADLPDETRHAILADFEAAYREVAAKVRRYPNGHVEPADGFRVAVRCTTKVRASALAAGWTPECAERLATLAGQWYAEILGDVAKQTRR